MIKNILNWSESVDKEISSPEISIVIVSWNVCNLLKCCIDSIVNFAGNIPLEIIVVDNASTDNTIEVLKNYFPWVRLIENKINVGFAKANNQGFEIAYGKYIFVLNPDTLLVEKSLIYLKNHLDKNPKIGIVGPKIIFPNGKIQYTCARVLPSLCGTLFCNSLRLNKLPFIGKLIENKYLSPYDFNKSQSVKAISGAAFLSRGEIIRKLNGFGEVFLHTGEDVDFCYRVQQAGWNIEYLNEAVVIHYGGKSSNQDIPRISIYSALSVQQYFRRCSSEKAAFYYELICKFIDAPITLIISLIKLILGKQQIKEFKETIISIKGIWKWKMI